MAFLAEKASPNFIIGVRTWRESEDGSIKPSEIDFQEEDEMAALEDELVHNLSLEELAQLKSMQLAEVTTLQEIYGDSLDCPSSNVLVLKYPEVRLNIVTGTHYPRQPPTWEVENHHLTWRAVDILREKLRDYIRSRANDASVKVHHYNFLLGLASATDDFLSGHRTKIVETAKTTGNKKKSAKIEEFADSAYAILGKTLPQIISKLGTDMRVLHVETVLRKNLRSNFLAKREELRRKFDEMDIRQLLSCIPKGNRSKKRKVDIIEELTRPRVTFHGTDAISVPNIVRCGFLIPGTKNPVSGGELNVRCGSTYGKGIYTSPDPRFSHSYTLGEKTNHEKKSIGGRKIIVCAQLMGRSLCVGRGEAWGTSEALMEADSHVSANQLEYIVFDPAMVLPCYVIHYETMDEDHTVITGNDDQDTYTRNSSSINRLKEKFGPTIAPGERQRQKAEIFARGSKWFPYGYDPATNGKFVIEDVAEVDDDEEEWGNYQEDRAAEGDDGFDPWGNSIIQGMTDKDQYWKQRIEKVEREKKS